MSRLTSVALSASATVATAVVVFGAHTAGATSTAECTAWAALPAKVALTGREHAVHPTLTGTSCSGQTFENGATATLYGPRGTHPYDQRWQHFGTDETINVLAGVTTLGTYRMRNGDVQLYDANSVRKPARWVVTSMTVRYAGSVKVGHRTPGGVSGRAEHYSTYGWVGSSSVPVRLQQRAASGWRTVRSVRADRAGRFTFHGRFGAGLRVVVADAGDYWGASATVR